MSKRKSPPKSQVDVAIVGGGVAGGLTAYFLAHSRPELSIALLEGDDSLGGNQTYTFFESDVSAAALETLKPMISHTWSSTSVEFPRLKRSLDTAFHAVRAKDFNRIICDKLGDSVHLATRASKLTDTTVVTEDGGSLDAKVVFDTRGLPELPAPGLNGFHKLLGYDMTLEAPHGLSAPLLFDATCPQLDGFRYFSLLPWDQTRLLVREVFYSDTPDLNVDRISRSIKSYVERRGWKIASIDREERSVLPIPLTADAIVSSVAGEAVPLGLRAGFFHSTAGTVLPDAVRFAEFLGKVNEKTPELTTTSARDGLAKHRRPWLSRQRFYRLLNRLMYQASEPGLRYTIFQKFYEHQDDVIQRFFSGRSTWTDRLRMISSKPPVPVSLAFKNFSERSAIERSAASKPS